MNHRALQYTTHTTSALSCLAPGRECRATAQIGRNRPYLDDGLWRKMFIPAFVPPPQTPAGARNHRAVPSDPRAGLRRPGRFIRTPGDPANSLWATERQAETLRDPRLDGSPILWAMAAANVGYITPPPRVQELVGGGRPTTAGERGPSHAYALPRVVVKRSRILPEVCFILIFLFQDPMRCLTHDARAEKSQGRCG